MYTINIKHRGDSDVTTYKIYKKKEADSEGLTYVHWKDSQAGGWAISDDDYVSKVISRREYPHRIDGINIYLRFPWGYTFFSPERSSKPLKVQGRKTNVTFTGKSYIEVQSGQNKMKNLASMFALKPDYDVAIEWALGVVTESERRKWKRTMKSEVFKDMVREEMQKLLQDHGLTEGFTLSLLEEAIEMSKVKKDITNLMRAVENLQDMHGMKEKHLVKTTDKLEATSSTKLIDELLEEEKSFLASRTTIEEVDESYKSSSTEKDRLSGEEEVEEVE
tara:strand:- start:2363 stop:3193 length:831 start_codon:yes stop_codon:yes gene_type:complete